MKKLHLIFVFTFCFCGMFITNLFSQHIDSNLSSNSKKSIQRNGGLYLLQGFRSQNFSQINNRLAGFDFASTKKVTQFSGAGGYGWFGRFKVGGEGNYMRSENEDDKKTTELQGFGGNFYTAYLINPKSKLHILPLIGFGGESLALSSNKNNSAATTFSQAIEAPQTLQLKTGSFYLKTALQFEYKVRKSVMGFQVGYHFAPSQKWQINSNSFDDSPINNLSNFFLQFTIGLE